MTSWAYAQYVQRADHACRTLDWSAEIRNAINWARLQHDFTTSKSGLTARVEVHKSDKEARPSTSEDVSAAQELQYRGRQWRY